MAKEYVSQKFSFLDHFLTLWDLSGDVCRRGLDLSPMIVGLWNHYQFNPTNMVTQ